ncbi:MAG: hypothetical protein CMI79_04980 [Candidatus Pelagibacter sp.]|nr:hypothetical protein [Candidatus Pelagibacter sp.]|tara:strand:- start:13013 stop:13204 length:192 start_codon:yes stop_codon:yes gene_type:complete
MRSERIEENLEEASVPNETSSKVDLNNLIKKIRDEEKKTRRNSVFYSAAALSVLIIFGIVLTL